MQVYDNITKFSYLRHPPLAHRDAPCYPGRMAKDVAHSLPADLADELERKFFWWEPVTSAPRSHAHILAQAMNFAPYDDVRRLEQTPGPACLVQVMLDAEPGWF